MLEISPVLAGTFDQPAYIPATANITSGAATPATADTDPVAGNASVDPRRYSQFDRTASQVVDAAMSFGDVLDMINPLQHIPVVSSLYRSITGDTINPVARVVGDIAYGAPLGLVTALANGVGAVADSVMEAKTGKDMEGTVLAELFGSDKDAVENGTAAQAQIASAATTPAAVAAASAGNASAAQAAPAFALNAKGNNKLPYGGVMAPVQNLQQQNMMMALASSTSANGVRIGNTLYTNRFLNGPHPAPTTGASSSRAAPGASSIASLQTLPGVLPATAVPAGQTPVTLPIMAAEASSSPTSAAAQGAVNPATTADLTDRTIPKELSDDALIMKALGLYQSVGLRSGNSGTKTLN